MVLLTRRNALAAAVALTATTGVAQAKDWTKVRVGIEGAYPPFSRINAKGSLEGFDVDIARALCKQIGADCVLVQQDWPLVPGLLAGKYDCIVASMSMTDERRKTVDFTDKYYHTPARFVAKKGSDIAITLDGLKGKKVGVQRNTTHDSFLTDKFGNTAQIVRYATSTEANKDLLAGKLDLRLDDSLTISDALLKTGKGKDFQLVGPAYDDPRWFGSGAGIALRKDDQDLKRLLNQAIAAIRANGVYDKISKKYFDFDIYGT